ncbi:MAG: HD domain-containing protein [Patescibacteria group bacterium]
MKKYNYKKIRDEVKRIVKDACYSANNNFSYTAWQYHIVPVAKHSLHLGKILKADLEVLELAAYLHDYSGILNYKFYKKHHLHSARLADKILNDLDFPSEKIDLIKKCIINHRGSVEMKKKSLEEKILASADAMSHFTELADMFYLAFGIHKYKTREGAKWLGEKLERSWKKIIPIGRKMIKSEREISKKIILKAILLKK